jgi:hypothetical protein
MRQECKIVEETTSIQIECLISCLLCYVILQDSKDRYAVHGRSSFDILGSIKSLQWNGNVPEKFVYVCSKCLLHLKKD